MSLSLYVQIYIALSVWLSSPCTCSKALALMHKRILLVHSKLCLYVIKCIKLGASWGRLIQQMTRNGEYHRKNPLCSCNVSCIHVPWLKTTCSFDDNVKRLWANIFAPRPVKGTQEEDAYGRRNLLRGAIHRRSLPVCCAQCWRTSQSLWPSGRIWHKNLEKVCERIGTEQDECVWPAYNKYELPNSDLALHEEIVYKST